jgi:hypothetical protein
VSQAIRALSLILVRRLDELDARLEGVRDHREVRRIKRLQRHAGMLLMKLVVGKKKPKK